MTGFSSFTTPLVIVLGRYGPIAVVGHRSPPISLSLIGLAWPSTTANSDVILSPVRGPGTRKSNVCRTAVKSANDILRQCREARNMSLQEQLFITAADPDRRR